MLNQDTKRKIDSARDILVGKVPDPKAQVEQITTALIYKFMDDLDKESEELGGKPRFFVNEFEKYAWTKLFDTRLGGFERLNLYVEALLKMPQNKYIPQLFRDILKDAFLPYRDPETLTLFLKEINEFTYDHSEKLGDAYEYLLSVLGSQGDAGQFRTPRHIIDFIVEVIDPKKDETVLDPACGTAGFLISGYKHILKQNTKERSGDQLTPDEKKKLMSHFMGYDISPDMVRLSLTNMYLHSFPSPNIYEYDTLTSEERWDETYDVIMANPPFMSPKGGIRPHKRFTTQATRSEVLFVDYIAEHLNVNGRAGVIVPEGIIFKSDSAYKSLRKTLVEANYLYAVVSLPAGIFQPYSGVKTSILLMDKSLAKKADSILFVKVENDGFDLGAQRRAIKKNDLLQALSILRQYKQTLQNDGNLNDLLPGFLASKATIVKKAKIADSGSYNLSGERYHITTYNTQGKWSMMRLEEVCKIERGASPRPIEQYITNDSTGLNWVKIGDTKNADKYIVQTAEKITLEGAKKSRKVFVGDFVLSNSMSFGHPYIMKIEGYIHDGWLRLSEDTSRIDKDFMYYILGSDLVKEQFEKVATGGVVRNLNSELVRKVEIPLPPLEDQKKIVAELESYQKVIDGAKQVVENYKPSVKIDPNWETVRLETLCEIKHGYAFKGEYFKEEAEGNEPILLTPGNFLETGGLYFNHRNVKRYTDTFSDEYVLQKGDLVIVMTDLSTKMKILGNPALINEDNLLHNQRIGKIILKSDSVTLQYLYYIFLSEIMKDNIKSSATGTTVKHTSPTRILECEIPLPPREIQEQITSQLTEEQKLIQANKRLIKIFEQKIKDKISEVWGENTASSTDITPTTPVLVG